MTNAVIGGLEALQSEAPAALLPRVLIEAGLADGYETRPSGLGDVWIAFNGIGVSACVPVDEANGVESYLWALTGRPAFEAEMPERLAGKVDEALATGNARHLPYDLRGVSDFSQAVLAKASEIPPGEVRPYGWVAREIGRPKAARAVGTALARNPVPVLIPCHRVIRSDGTVGQYAYGSERKQRILQAEGLDVEELADLANHFS